MKKFLTFLVISLWNQSSFSETSPLIIISDEINSKGDLSTSINSSLYINNSENFNYLSISPSIRYGIKNNLLLVSSISGSYSVYSAINNDDGYFSTK